MIQRIVRKIRRTIASSPIYQKLTTRRKSVTETHDYWRNPTDGGNTAESYISADENVQNRSKLLLEMISGRLPKEAAILEIGCNAGRNLDYLYRNGYTNLEAVEISQRAIEVLKSTFPHLAKDVPIHCSPVEEFMPKLPDGKFDLVFTMAVFEHIHSESEWIFPEVVRASRKYVMTIEDEQFLSWRHFPRKYDEIFLPLGLKQVAVVQSEYEKYGLGPQFFARIFEKV